ncbi:hypothetical protein ARMGADRAFT_1031954 [Armillaria gallica]|uniref:Uncharacterized protein n=1 Tax=Armillaria gallica TaxID=47427 RepID=A0A2H3DIH9_ARMGA|nr:hypothetical protein ARMGADRAFT_1031954 [Armillaria gallica]
MYKIGNLHADIRGKSGNQARLLRGKDPSVAKLPGVSMLSYLSVRFPQCFDVFISHGQMNAAGSCGIVVRLPQAGSIQLPPSFGVMARYGVRPFGWEAVLHVREPAEDNMDRVLYHIDKTERLHLEIEVYRRSEGTPFTSLTTYAHVVAFRRGFVSIRSYVVATV